MINANITRLAWAIGQVEGWDPLKGGGPSGADPTLASRNHNPGNLRSSPFQVGTGNGFAIFYNDATGWFALSWDLWKKARGETRTGLNGENTIEDLIRVYAPSRENDTDAYIIAVEKWSGFFRSTQLKELLQ